jgi:hypothetical protein
MLNRWTIPLAILCVLSIPFDAFAQEQSDSHIITVEKKIDVAELDEKVDDLDQSRQDLTQTLKNLNNSINNLNTNVEYLNVTVARLDERTKGIFNLQYIIVGGIVTIFATLLASIVVFFLTQGVLHRRKRDSDGEATAAQVSQISQNEPTPVRTVQSGESQIVSTQATQVSQSDASPTQPTQEHASKTNPAKASGASRNEKTPPKSQQENSLNKGNLKEILKIDSNFKTRV